MKSRKAWVFDREGKWYCGWYEPDGRRRKKSFGKSKKAANDWAAKQSARLVEGVSDCLSVTWGEFIEQFREQKMAKLAPGSREVYNPAIAHFERLIGPKKPSDVTTAAVDRFIAKRLKERGKKPGSTVSPATVNKDLRALKRVFRTAHAWKMLKEVPSIEFVREPKVGITFISPEQFSELYAACDAAEKPELPNIQTADWWRAFLVFIYMTGWRASEPLRLLWEDVDLGEGWAVTRASDNKNKAESTIPLHPIVVDHLEAVRGFSLEVFPWPHGTKQLWVEFAKIQAKAGVKKVCRKNHPHNDACQRFGFHDLRRGFATANANSLSASQLQTMMRHQSYTTTQLYIEMAEQSKRADVTSKLAVPTLKTGG